MFEFFNHYRYRRHVAAVIVIVITALILCTPILFLDQCLKWDAADYFLPIRFTIADAFHHHQLPKWNPFTRYGFPLHADPQSGACYLPVLATAYFFGYNFKILAWEFFFHICIAGTGFYFLSYSLHKMQPCSRFVIQNSCGICNI